MQLFVASFSNQPQQLVANFSYLFSMRFTALSNRLSCSLLCCSSSLSRSCCSRSRKVFWLYACLMDIIKQNTTTMAITKVKENIHI